ncbi:hypothetical protein D3C81_1114560 [compost metagenome]
MVEDRPLLEDEGAVLRTVDLGAGDVRREQVGGELDAVELGLQAFRQVLDGLGLGQPGRTLHQQVTVGEERDEQTLDELFLAENLAGEKLSQRKKRLTMGHRGISWTGNTGRNSRSGPLLYCIGGGSCMAVAPRLGCRCGWRVAPALRRYGGNTARTRTLVPCPASR